MSKQKVMVGMSGGIDSSVTAYILQKDGYEVEGVYLKLHDRTDGYHESNLSYIDGVAKFLGINPDYAIGKFQSKQTYYKI